MLVPRNCLSALVVGLILTSTAGAASDLRPLVIEPAVVDVGVVDQGDSVRGEFRYRNNGGAVLSLSDPIVACDCRAEVTGPADLAPGGTGVIRVVCDTDDFAGELERSITVVSSAVEQRTTLLHLRARVRVEAIADPSRVYLGAVVRGSQHTDLVSLRFAKSVDLGPSAQWVSTDGETLRVLGPKVGSVARALAVAVRDDAPLGEFTQEVTVKTASRRFPLLRVAITGIVVESLPRSRW